MGSHFQCGNNLNLMDNAGFDQDADRGNVELAAVMLPPHQHQLQHIVVTPATASNGNGVVAGCSDACLAMHQQHNNSASKPPESPWHHLKTIFLVGTIVFLAIWILVYTLLSQFNAL